MVKGSSFKFFLSCYGAIILAGAVGACANTVKNSPDAVAHLQPTSGNRVHGEVEFHKEGRFVRIRGVIRGLRPVREHGFHIHEKGDCSSADGLSAGDHFNPQGHMHGAHGRGGAHHAGDLPSLTSDEFGTARFDFWTPHVALQEGPLSILNTALIVHADPDDFRTQPSGNSGKRVACGIVSIY